MTEPAFYAIKNWSQFQHYKDRNPTWIKMHFALLASEDWVMLDDASKLLAVVCMLVASRHEGKVPNKPAYLKRIAYLDQVPDLQPLIECGFLSETLAPASISQATARPETETYREEAEQKDTEANASATVVLPPDVRKALWSDGLASLRRQTGLPEDRAKRLIGKWLKAGGDNATTVLTKIKQSEVDGRDAIPWIEAGLKASRGVTTEQLFARG